MKADLQILKIAMQRNGVDVRKIAKILEDVQCEIVSQIDGDKAPAVKKQFVILVPEQSGKDKSGWVIQIPEEDDPHVVADRLTQAAIRYNMTKKGMRMPIKTIGEVCEFCPPRVLKESNVWVKTKEPVYVISVRNKLPRG